MKPRASGNTFHGTLIEFPSIGVDKFNIDASVYLLTHVHKDHLVGLNNQSFGATVYCSELTRELLALDPEYKLALPYIKLVCFNKPIRVSIDGEDISITLIPSYHCPGSTLFLVESNTKRVLVTGDIRAETWWIESLKKNVYLQPYITGQSTLDNIYLDTTFGYRGEPYIEIPPNEDGISAVIQLLMLYPKDESDIQVYFKDLVLGFEEAWALIVSASNGTLHISDSGIKKRHQLMDSGNYIVPYGGVLNQVTGDPNPNNLNFHVCNEEKCCSRKKFKIRVKQCIDFNVVDFVGSLLPVNLEHLSQSEREGITILDHTSKGYEICEYRGRQWLKVGNELLPSDIKLVFSRHSSYTECKTLVDLFKPIQVYPCVASENTWKNGFIMSRVFGNQCRLNKLSRFCYDIDQSSLYGLPTIEDIQRPITVINRWDFEQCEKELQFVDNYISNENPKLQLETNSHKPSLHTIINDRYDTKFRMFIDKTQKLYMKYLIQGLPGQRQRYYVHELYDMDRETFFCSTYSYSESETISFSIRESEGGKDHGTDETKLVDDTKVVDEFGVATRIPTLVDDNIKSSMDSIDLTLQRNEVSFDAVDTGTIRLVTKRLKQNPDHYFDMTLASLAKQPNKTNSPSIGENI